MPLANAAAAYAVYKGVKGLMSRLKTSSPKKKKTPKVGAVDYNARKAHNKATQKRYSDYEEANKR